MHEARSSSPIPSDKHPNPKETPRKPRQTLTSSYKSGALELARPAIMKDISSIPEVSFEFYLASVLPMPKILSDISVENVKTALEQSSVLTDGRWADFPTDPAQTRSEENTFNGLLNITNEILKAADISASPSCILVQRPHEAPSSSRANKTRPDGYMLYSSHSSEDGKQDVRADWCSIVEVEEYKRCATHNEVQQNREKLVWGMHHVMRADPRRRFTFGMTIENTNTRLWFFHRSHGMVTEAFNFITEHEKYIEYVLRLSYASEEELGYDETITTVGHDNGIPKYEIDVGERKFLTIRVLSDVAADRLCGRATRVFRVCDKDNPAHELALKDQWIDEDREAEAIRLEDLRASIQSAHSKSMYRDMDLPKNPMDYFLSVNAHCRVRVNGIEDNTATTVMRGRSLPEKCPSFNLVFERIVRSHTSKGGTEGSTGHIPCLNPSLVPIEPFIPAHITPRRHDRTVFNEVGEALHDLDDLSSFFHALADCTLALEIVHRLGFVHRDISTGNILLYQGGGLLSDLEFMKEITSLGCHEVKTGTRQFTAVEIERNRYEFRKPFKAQSTGPRLPPFALLETLADRDKVEPGVIYNRLHDHESVWWIACWALLNYVPVNHQFDDGTIRPQVEYVDKLFHPTVFHTERLETIQSGLPSQVVDSLPKEFVLFHRAIDFLRSNLVDRYSLAENADGSIDLKHFDDFWYSASEYYATLSEKLKSVPVKRLSFVLEKRKHDTEQHDGPSKKYQKQG